mmetsp:Transcript_7001/g.16331  ORF Transcript_7001/g.16331 Transcript_7001/m.16331 type:complete len:681 (-) Transcript_7001:1870-3912(-)
MILRCGVLAVAERACILEKTQPRHRRVSAPLRGAPRVLPAEEAALRVRHHREVAAVLGAESGDAVHRAVGVERVRLGDVQIVVDVPQRRQLLLEHLVKYRRVREVRLALAVRDPHAERRAFHALEQHRRRRLDHHRGPPRLEAAALVVNEARLLLLRQRLARRHPAEQSHELAAVAHSERESVVTRAESSELRGDLGIEADDASPAFGRAQDVCVREAANEDDAAEPVQVDAAAHQVCHRDVPRLHAGRVEGGGHLAVSIRAFLPNDSDARRRLDHRCRRRRRRSEGERPLRRVSVCHTGLLLLHTLRVALHRLERKRRRLPDVAQLGQLRVEHRLGRRLDEHALLGGGATHARARHPRLRVRRQHCRLIRRAHLEEEQRLFGEARLVCGAALAHVEREAHVSGESHLEGGHEQPAVTNVVAAEKELGAQQLLRDREGGCEKLRAVDVRRRVAELSEDLREGAASETPPPFGGIDEQQPRLRRLEVRRERQPHIRARRVHGDHERAGRLDCLVAHASRHRKRVLAAVNGNAEQLHELAHGRARVVHHRALAPQLRSPHPIGGALDLVERRDGRPHEVGERLSDGKPTHGPRAEEALDGLLTHRSRAARGALVCLRDDAHVCERRVQRTDALLLRDQSTDRAVDLVGEEALGADGWQPQHTVKRGGEGEACWQLERLERVW